MTERLYYDDAYLTEFDARVAETRPDGWVALDRSAFYPTSGGQPYDTGVLEFEDQSVAVTDVEVKDDVVWHRIDGVLKAGQRVHGRIDWARRFEHMQQHAADHMLAGAAWELYGGVTIGLHLGKEDSTIDMDLPGGRTHLTREEIDTLEALVNARVQADDPIRCWFPEPEALDRLPLRKRPTVSEHVRVVAMGDYEMVACGGTHPRTTGQIGPVKIISSAPARGKMRLCFVAGMRAVHYIQRAVRCAVEVSALVSADFDTAADALKREREAAQQVRREQNQRLTLAALEHLRATRQGDLYCGHVEYADHEVLQHAAVELIRDPKAVALLSCPRGEGRLLIFARGTQAAPDMAALLRSSGARGGGKPDMAQGSAADDAALKNALAALL